jgi:hypothetical protein
MFMNENNYCRFEWYIEATWEFISHSPQYYKSMLVHKAHMLTSIF